MNTGVDKQLRALDLELNALLEELKHYSEDQLNRRPAENKWSILQVIHHVMMVEAAGYRYIKKKLSFEPELKKAGIPSFLRRQALLLYLRTPLRRKAPKAVGDGALPERSSFWETAKEWKQLRSDIRDYLGELPESHFDKSIYKHPAIGRVSLSGMLAFYRGHFQRHRKQIRRITKHYYL